MRPIAVDCIILKRNKILLIKRGHEPFKDMWALPGGLVEDLESAEEACIRETKEETGLDVKIKKLAGVYSDPGRDPRKVISIVFLCEYTGIPKAGDDAKEVGWFEIGELPELAADHKKIIENVME
ncbi:NUDIX hydrolase [Candidatus Micrarchaeota archaeon]|nr:NUDIX hydrolase [Candidatus Micrarchaeota archaeon]